MINNHNIKLLAPYIDNIIILFKSINKNEDVS